MEINEENSNKVVDYYPKNSAHEAKQTNKGTNKIIY